MSKIENRVHPVNPKSGAQNQQHQRQGQNNGQNNQNQGNNSNNPVREKAWPSDGFDTAKKNPVNLSGGTTQNPLSVNKDGLVTGRLGDQAAGPATIQVINDAGGRDSMGVSFKGHIAESGVANFRIPKNGTSGIQITVNDGVTYEAKKG